MKPVSFHPLLITGLALTLSLQTIAAQETGGRITSVEVDTATGNILLHVTGSGFDPLMRMEQTSDGDYRIIVEAENVTLDNAVRKEIQKLSTDLSRSIPAIDAVNFFQLREGEIPITRVVFDATGKLQPQIRSNTGTLITIALIGDKKGKPKPDPPPEMGAQKIEHGKKSSRMETVTKNTADAEKAVKDEPRKKRTAIRDTSLQKLFGPKKAVSKAESPATGGTDTHRAKPPEPVQQEAKPDLSFQSLPAVSPSPSPPSSTNTAPLKFNPNPIPGEIVFDPSAMPDEEELREPTPMPIRLTATPPEFSIPEEQPAPAVTPPITNKPTAKASASPIKKPVIFKADFNPPKNTTAMNDPLVFKTEFSPANTASIAKAASPALHATNKTDQQYEYFSLYEAVKNPATDGIVRQAWGDLQKGEYAATEMTLRTFLEGNPRNVTARFLLAQIYLGSFGVTLNKRDLAIQELKQILNLHGDFYPAYMQLLPLYLQNQAYDEAEKLLKTAASRWPEDPGVLYYQGMIHEAMNNIGLAQAAYIEALKNDPQHFMAHYRLGMLAMKSSQPEMARWELQQALLLSPGDVRILKLLGYLAEKDNNQGIAEHYYREALPADVLTNYARLLETRNEPEKAIQIYAAVENIAQDNPDILFNLGMIYSQRKDLKRAEAAMKRFLKLTENSDDSRIEKAREITRNAR